VLRQQEDESPVADLGLYPKKVNDGGRPAPFGARITFDDPSGPITIDPAEWGGNPVLTRARGPEHAIYDVLTEPMSAAAIAEAAGQSERNVKRILSDHPRMFVDLSGNASGGKGHAKLWARHAPERSLWYQDRDDEEVPL
jgi:hypothetical protein